MRPVIHIVDDDASFRTAVGRLLRESGYEIVVYESAKQLLERLADDFVPGCILLDVQIPGLSGPELQDHLIKKGSTLPIIFLTGYGDIPTSVKAIKAGADDFLTKPVAREQLLASIERAIARHERTKQQRDRVDALRFLAGKLTPRESEVFKLVILGKMNKQIAHELGTTERTIKAHRQRVMQKLQVQSLAELVSIGERIGVLSESASEPTNESARLEELNYFFTEPRAQVANRALASRGLSIFQTLDLYQKAGLSTSRYFDWRGRRCLFRSRWPHMRTKSFPASPGLCRNRFRGEMIRDGTKARVRSG